MSSASKDQVGLEMQENADLQAVTMKRGVLSPVPAYSHILLHVYTLRYLY